MTPEHGTGTGQMRAASCRTDHDGCITCGDVAVALTALATGETDVRCADEQGREEVVALELVGPARSGDRFLVHAGTAIARLPASGRTAP